MRASKSRPGAGVVTFEHRAINQRDELVCSCLRSALLKNLTYVGKIKHGDRVHPGLHPALIDQDTFDRAQALLASHLQNDGRRVRAARPSPLAGKLVDHAGAPLLATHATKGRARYRYFVSRDLHHRRTTAGLRVPAREIEGLVAEELAQLFVDPFALIARLQLDVPVDWLTLFDARCRDVRAELGRVSASSLHGWSSG